MFSRSLGFDELQQRSLLACQRWLARTKETAGTFRAPMLLLSAERPVVGIELTKLFQKREPDVFTNFWERNFVETIANSKRNRLISLLACSE